MSRIFDIANKYVDQIAALEPTLATSIGVPGHEREMPDHSPAGPARVADLNRRTVAELQTIEPDNDWDRIARDVMLERLGVSLEVFAAKEYMRSLRNIASPLQGVRQVFDYMPKDTEEDWSNIAARLALVPQSLAGYRQSLSEGLASSLYASKRQATEGAEQARIWSGAVAGEGKPSYFTGLQETFDKARADKPLPDSLAADIATGVGVAMDAYGEMYRYLRDDYVPNTSERESAGDERYTLMSRVFLGATIDPRETYQWGWEELHRIEDEMRATAEKIQPGKPLEDVMHFLETDDSRAVMGEDNYRQWLQDLHDEALEELHGKHFDIPDSIHKVEVMIPPPGGALAAYYTGPSEDLKRPGRTWWPTGGNQRFAKWGDVTTVYHEGPAAIALFCRCKVFQ